VGYSNTKVAPEKIVFWRPVMFDAKAKSNAEFFVMGRGFGHITKQTDWRELGAKLRKLASDHGANAIAYDISGTHIRLQFIRVPDATFNAGIGQNELKRPQ